MKRIQCRMLLLASLYAILANVPIARAMNLTTYVCAEGKVAVGDILSDVSLKCPAAEQAGSTTANPNPLWVLLDPAARRVVYFQFVDNRLQRIYTSPCLTTADARQDPNCASMQSLPDN